MVGAAFEHVEAGQQQVSTLALRLRRTIAHDDGDQAVPLRIAEAARLKPAALVKPVLSPSTPGIRPSRWLVLYIVLPR
jgi:hypothetical protein